MTITDEIAELQTIILDREAAILERENTVREREAEIQRLEAEIDRMVITGPSGQRPRQAGGLDALRMQITTSLAALRGWCMPQKAFLLADWILNNDIQVAVEIGIFGGQSLVPMALAMRHAGRGVIYGVDPWSKSVAVEDSTSAENDIWWQNIDLAGVKSSFLEYVVANGLGDTIKVIEASSDEALAVFSNPRFAGRIDLVHIDGSHAEEQALRDVTSWLPLMRANGIIVLDDICWASVLPAYRYLAERCEVIAELRFGAFVEGRLSEGFAAFRTPDQSGHPMP